MSRGKLPIGFGKTLKALYAQGYSSKDAMREAWKIHRGRGPGMHGKQQPQQYLNPISHKKALRYARELVKHEKVGVKKNPIIVYNPEMRPRIQVSKKARRGKIGERSPLKGYKINPSIVTGATPLPLRNVEIRYQRANGSYRGEWFRHPFKSSVEVLGLKDGSILIRSLIGKTLWGTV